MSFLDKLREAIPSTGTVGANAAVQTAKNIMDAASVVGVAPPAYSAGLGVANSLFGDAPVDRSNYVNYSNTYHMSQDPLAGSYRSNPNALSEYNSNIDAYVGDTADWHDQDFAKDFEIIGEDGKKHRLVVGYKYGVDGWGDRDESTAQIVNIYDKDVGTDPVYGREKLRNYLKNLFNTDTGKYYITDNGLYEYGNIVDPENRHQYVYDIASGSASDKNQQYGWGRNVSQYDPSMMFPWSGDVYQRSRGPIVMPEGQTVPQNGLLY